MKNILRAARDAAAVLGLGALLGFVCVERSLVWIVPAVALIVGTFVSCYKIRVAVALRGRSTKPARHGLPTKDAREVPAVRPLPKSAKYRYVLMQDGIPVAVEYDKKRADLWLGLGPEYDFEVYDNREGVHVA